MDKKYVKELKNYYISKFLKSDISYTKVDINEWPDDWSDVRYISENISSSSGRFKYNIKNSFFRKYLLVIIESTNRERTQIVLYNDIFSLKRKNVIKDKMIYIINQIEYKKINDLIGEEASRIIKLKIIKSKCDGNS